MHAVKMIPYSGEKRSGYDVHTRTTGAMVDNAKQVLEATKHALRKMRSPVKQDFSRACPDRNQFPRRVFRKFVICSGRTAEKLILSPVSGWGRDSDVAARQSPVPVRLFLE